MKNALLTVIYFLSISIVFSQETNKTKQSSGLEFKSMTHALGVYNLEKLKGKTSLSLSSQVTFQTNKHLLGLSFALGSGILNEDDILKNSIHFFADINLLYGREFEIVEDVKIDIFSGIGYLEQTKLKNNDQGGSLNIPIRSKLMFVASKRTRFGFITQLNFNSKNDIFMYQFFLQFEF